MDRLTVIRFEYDKEIGQKDVPSLHELLCRAIFEEDLQALRTLHINVSDLTEYDASVSN